MARLPRPYENFMKIYPEIWKAYDRLGGLVHDAGPLDKKQRELMKLAMAIGARLEGAVHSHTRRALEQGAKPAEIYHVVLLGHDDTGLSPNDCRLDLGRRGFEKKPWPQGKTQEGLTSVELPPSHFVCGLRPSTIDGSRETLSEQFLIPVMMSGPNRKIRSPVRLR